MNRPAMLAPAPIAVGIALLVAACGGQRGEPPRCPPPIPVPAGFEVTSDLADPFPDRVATRSSLGDAWGRSLHRFSGLEGEFGEGLPLAEPALALASGATARLLGQGEVWALVWREREEGPCASRAIFASGFRRAAFLRVLREVGLLADVVPGPGG